MQYLPQFIGLATIALLYTGAKKMRSSKNGVNPVEVRPRLE